MNFTDTLFQKINQKIWDVGSFLEQLKREKVVIWGTGLAGHMISEALEQMQIPVFAFADNNTEKAGISICQKKVLSINQIPSDAFVIIAANVKYKIHEQLQSRSIKNIHLDPLWIYSYKGNNILSILHDASDLIDKVYDMLADDASKKVYENILLHRAVHDISLVWEVYDTNQYFCNTIIPKAGKHFVDCGAYQGDTLLHFLEQTEPRETYHYYAFEADQKNYEILKTLCDEKKLDWVKPYNLGVWDKPGQLYFQENQTTGEVSGKVSESSGGQDTAIRVDSLDDVLGNTKVDFIKMDIEGAEIKALEGAQNCIKNNVPTLAISAYHELNHLWEVPLLIKKLDDKYRLYFRHHMWNMADTVCYGIQR